MANGAPSNTIVVIAGLANDYSQYVTTPEEFRTPSIERLALICVALTPLCLIEIQRYEGGSTLFGPYTLPAYQQEFSKLAVAFIRNQSYTAGPTPINWESKMVCYHISYFLGHLLTLRYGSSFCNPVSSMTMDLSER